MRGAVVSGGRVPAAGLGIGAAILASWIAAEGFSAAPIIPVRGDVPTIGHGATRYEDGRRVNMADPPITRERARDLAVNLLEQQYGVCVRDSLGDTLVHPVEFSQAVDFAGQYGCGAWRGSSMLARTHAGDYAGACHAYLAYRFMTSAQPLQGYAAYQWGAGGQPSRWRFDCSTPGNKVCRGVWTRQQARYAACMEVQ
ncbi:Phage-related lysozyme (muramidase), GH24 family [Delftia tsuruhatensis]|uniref:glycoside hydrolase family protein n=1 Tax=Pseudomonas sp. TaxID=306 RepID=UPI0008EAE400|nr:lysozyme [Pseudomonas sp.]SFB66191.1 Phage-related lysozyme (muramidase), GH24 family [Delftia tsuruhatensis]